MHDSPLRSEADQDRLLLDIYSMSREVAIWMVKEQDVDDLVHDVAVKCLVSLRTRPWRSLPRNLPAFVWALVRNQVINRYRKRRRSAKYDSQYVDQCAESPPAWMSPDRSGDEEAIIAFRLRLLERLPDRCRKAYHMVRVEGARYEDVARHMGVARETVHWYIKKVNRLFREELHRNGADPDPVKGRSGSATNRRKNASRGVRYATPRAVPAER